jgi:glycine betaine/proline transport system substrate-binding protein
MVSWRLMGALCASLSLGDAGLAAAQDAGKVRLGQIGISFYAVTAGVIQEVLERMGHTVEVSQGSHGQIFPRLGAGEVDLFVAAWLPHGHAVYWDQYKDRAVELAVLYQGARFYWMVPTYIPESAVASVADLNKPDVLMRMDRQIPGTGPDSGLMIQSAKMMTAYGLDTAGYVLQPGPPARWIDNYERATREGRWFVMPLWKPQFINKVGNMRPIDEPKGILGEPNAGTLVASKDWVAHAPPRTVAVLRRIQLGLDAVAEMDYRVNKENMTPRDAARAWMAGHREVVDEWLTGG